MNTYIDLEIELVEEDGRKVVWLANDGSSGCKYYFETKEELKAIICDYVKDIVDYEIDFDNLK